MGTVIKNRGTSCVGVRKTGTTLIRVSTVMGTLYTASNAREIKHLVKDTFSLLAIRKICSDEQE